MDTAFVNHELEVAAKRTLTRITEAEDTLQPLYLLPDRALFLAENLRIIFKVYMTGRTLQRFHTIGAHPPFSGGQQQWEAFISWWVQEEIEKVKRLEILDLHQMSKLQEQFDRLRPLLAQRSVALLHGDLQTDHILVDPQTEHILAFLDFADAQAGDQLLDIAVVTLWDHGLTDFLLEGYSGIARTEEMQQLLSLYRLLRHLAEIPWLPERGFKTLAERNITALQASVRACHSSKALPDVNQRAWESG